MSSSKRNALLSVPSEKLVFASGPRASVETHEPAYQQFSHYVVQSALQLQPAYYDALH